MKALKDMMDAIAVQAQNLLAAIGNYMKDPAWLQADRIARMSPPIPGPGVVGGTSGMYYRELAATSDPAAIQKIWDAFIKDATDSLNYLVAIIQAVNSALASVDSATKAFHATARDYMKSDMWLQVDRTGRIAPNSSTSPWRQTLAGATTVADVQAAWDGFMADANAQLTYLIGIIQQVNSALASVDTTTKVFHKTLSDYTKSPEWLQADRIARTSAGGQWAGELANAATVADVQKTWDAFMVDANAALTYLLSIVTAVTAAMANVAVSTKAFHLAASDYMKDADWLQQDRVIRMAGRTSAPGTPVTGGTWETALAGANTVENIQAVWDSFIADATASLNYLIGIVNSANAGMKTANDLAAKFGSIMADAAEVTTVYTIWNDVVDLGTQYADAMKLSGQDQLTALDAINASAATLYASLMQIIQGINSAETSIHKSIQQQIWENNYSQAGTDPNRLGMINSQISGLMGGIGSQTTSGDVSSTASEVQSMISRYLGMFSANDPNRAAAIVQANAMLTALDKATRDQLEKLKAQAKKDAEDAKKLVDMTAQAFHDASVTATESIRLLGLAVDVFRADIDTKLHASMGAAWTEINKLNDSVTAFRTQVDTVLQGSLAWAIASIVDLSKAVDTFRDEVDTKLHGFADAAIMGIDKLGVSVAAFQGLVDGSLTGTVNNIVKELNLVGAAFITALGDFTIALEGPAVTPGAPPPGGGTGGPNDPQGPLIPAVNTGATALGFFTNAVNTATKALGGATS